MVKVSIGAISGRSFGFAGSFVLASLLAAHGQEAAQPQSAPPASTCSGVMCIFAPRPATQVSSQPEQTAQPVDQAAQSAPPPTSAAADEPGDGPARKTEPKRKPKPVPAITIAADGPEVGRMKDLAASMPKEKIKIVSGQERAKDAADFAVTTAFDPAEHGVGAEKAKLFTEQMHIVAGGAIHAVSDLDGKVVSFGADKSVSQAAARKAFEALDIHVKETPLELENALDGLSTGDIDAVVVLAPQPVARLASVTPGGLHLVSWPDGGAVPAGAVSASIDGGDYPGLAKPGATIRALGVDAVLKLSPKGARTPAARTFLAALSQHSTALSKRGFDLLKADLETRKGSRVASAERH